VALAAKKCPPSPYATDRFREKRPQPGSTVLLPSFPPSLGTGARNPPGYHPTPPPFTVTHQPGRRVGRGVAPKYPTQEALDFYIHSERLLKRLHAGDSGGGGGGGGGSALLPEACPPPKRRPSRGSPVRSAPPVATHECPCEQIPDPLPPSAVFHRSPEFPETQSR